MASKRILIVYYSLTGQTRRVIEHIDEALRAEGHETDVRLLEPIDPWDFPVPKTTFLWRNFLCWIGVNMNMPVHKMDLNPEDYDAVVLGTQTWHLYPSYPVGAFLDSEMGKVLAGKDVIIALTCRNRYRNAMSILKKKIKGLGGRVAEGYILVNPPDHMKPTLHMIFQGKDPEPGSEMAERVGRPFAFSTSDMDTAKVYAKGLAKRLKLPQLQTHPPFTIINDQNA